MNKMLQVGAASGGPPCGTDGGGGRDEVAAAPRPDSSAAERIVDVVDSKAAIRRWLGEAAPLRQDAVAFAMKGRLNFSIPHPNCGQNGCCSVRRLLHHARHHRLFRKEGPLMITIVKSE
jgi:hypothetical protein